MFPDLTRDDVFRLETRRLWLRWPRLADAQAIVRFAGEKAVAEMTARIPHPLTIGDVESFVLRTRRDNAEGSGLHARDHPQGQRRDRRRSASSRAPRTAFPISATGSAAPIGARATPRKPPGR